MAEPKKLKDLLRDIEIVQEAQRRDPSRKDIYAKMEKRYKKAATEMQDVKVIKPIKKKR